MAPGEIIGYALIAAGVSVAGMTVLWFAAEDQDDWRTDAYGDVPEVPAEAKRRAARALPGEGASKAARALSRTNDVIARHHGEAN